MLEIGRYVYEKSGMENLCMAGGVALNCVGNGRLLREGPYGNIWVQPLQVMQEGPWEQR